MRTDEHTSKFMRDFLVHYGVKGMRWGQRTASPVSVSQKGKKLKTKGGGGQPAHADAVRKAAVARTKKKSGINALSDKELTAYANRLQLEQRVKGLEYSQKGRARRFIGTLLGNQGKQAANQIASDGTSRAVKKTMAAAAAKKAAKTAAAAAV